MLLLPVILVSGCASFKQEMHAFPRELAMMMEKEECDCDILEFLGDKEGRLIRGGVVQGAYSYKKKTLRVDVDDSLLSYLSSTLTIDEVRQKARLVNPFDGQAYVISGVYQGEKPTVTITLKKGSEDAGTVGRLDSAGHGVIGTRTFQVKEERWWERATAREVVNGEARWHQYPDGAYIAIDSGDEGTTRIFQGAIPGKFAGMDTFVGLRAVAYLPRGRDENYGRDLFLFYFGWLFYETFTDDIMSLPYCLDREEDIVQDGCPGDMYVH